jgi:hypothetical protein
MSEDDDEEWEEYIRKLDRRLRRYDREIIKLLEKRRELAEMDAVEAFEELDTIPMEKLDEWTEDTSKKVAIYKRLRRKELALKKKYWELYGDDDDF